MIRPVLLKYSDEFIPNTKVIRNRSTNPDTPPTRVSDVYDTSRMIPPPGTLSGNHPELAVHPRMNFLSEHRLSHNVRASIAFHLSVIQLFAMIAFYLLFLPPLLLSGS